MDIYQGEAGMADIPAISFGTSGLRGPAEGFSPRRVDAYVGAFLARIGTGGERTVLIGADLRASSPRIAALCVAVAGRAGFNPVYAGTVPTPALAAYAMARNWPGVMVTGSHIPESHNGLKFYRRDGELLKEDEEPVQREAARRLLENGELEPTRLPDAEPAVAAQYVARYRNAFPPDALTGLRIGVDLHSAVGRDLLAEILTALGAQCFVFRRMERFIAVDTEALAPDDIVRAKEQISRHGLDAVVSTDGDGDRPLVIDETGRQINGDILGALTARLLAVDSVVTPLTSTTAIEQSGWFNHMERTRIGSPYVVSAMREMRQDRTIAGFEANGGFLLQTPAPIGEQVLAALPTRDAVLPILAVLFSARREGMPLSSLAALLPPRFMSADRLKDVAPDTGKAFLSAVLASSGTRASIHPALAEPAGIDTRDGVRMTLSGGEVIHFRQSGNAPEMRCYIETGDVDTTESLLSSVLAGMRRVIAQEERS